VRQQAELHGRLRVPGDKSISHRVLLLGALAEGDTVVAGLADGDDVRRTAAAVEALGAPVRPVGEVVVIEGGAARLHQPVGPLDLGNSGTGMRLLAGLVAGWPWRVELVGDASLSSRPMDRVAEPLRRMGAAVEGRGERCLPPLVIRGGSLRGIDYTVPVPSAQVKSAVLLAGLRATGPTTVREPRPTRPHTEDLLAAFGADVAVEETGTTRVVRLAPSTLAPVAVEVPGDPSQAAFWVVAACIVRGSRVVVEHVHVGPGRRGYLDVLARMGAAVEEVPTATPWAPSGVAGGRRPVGTGPMADLHASAGPLRATEVGAREVPGLIDEVPVLAVAAAVASGTTVFRGVGELRVKESDRLAGVVDLVRRFGAEASVEGDDLAVTGTAHLVPAVVDAAGDHRMAMAAAVAGLAAGGAQVEGWDAVQTSYPNFATDLRLLAGGDVVDVVEEPA